MRLFRTTVLAIVCGAAFAAPASAKNDLELLGDGNLNNITMIDFTGNGNRLEILQEFTGGTGSNTIRASIDGDFNGGPVGSSFSGAALLPGLEPGSLTQSGFDNAIAMNVEGSYNLFAFAQNGNGNRISATITGSNNQAAVLQEGTNNYAAFSQIGVGNLVSIVQRSW